jgi:uncharacterized protein YbjT (DUF2867 family)
VTTILVTGATGQLGRPTAIALGASGHEVRSMSRQHRPDLTTADLVTGVGLAAALDGVQVVVHAATTQGPADVAAAERLCAAAAAAGVQHLVLISIADIDKIPIKFYRDRCRIEEVVRSSGIPFTIQRATQFHFLVARFFSAQRLLPVLVAPSIRLQPVEVDEVAVRLATLASGEPGGAIPDIGGPEQRSVGEFARIWQRFVGRRRPVVPLRLPGRMFAAYDAGAGLVPGEPYGQLTFEAYLARRRTQAA